jgi:hypothetical protein
MMLIIGNVGGGISDCGLRIADFGLRNSNRLGLGLKMKFGHG